MNDSLRVLVLADDLTGSNEVGAIFAQHGFATMVTTEFVENTIQVVVLDTESRHLPPAEARTRVRQLAAAATAEGVSLIYKKTDSTLRGNIGSELCALRSADPAQLLFYVPAYPEMGRTVRAGHLYVNGTRVSDSEFSFDPLNPVKSSYVPDVLQEPCGPVFVVQPSNISAATIPGIYVCDGETDRDLQQAAELLLARGGRMLAAGPAGLAKYIARQISSTPLATPPIPRLPRCLVINGSRHEQSCRQIDYAKSLGWSICTPGEISSAKDQWRILQPQHDAPKPPAEFAADMGSVVGELIRRTQLDGLIVFGGDTAYAILRAIGEACLYPIAEILPGVPFARIGPPERKLHIVTKAGGFGPVDVLSQIRVRLGG